MTRDLARDTARDTAGQREWLHRRFPERARPVGFYPLPTTRPDVPFDPAWIGQDWIGQHRIGQDQPPGSRLLYVHVPFCNQRCHYCRFYPGPNSGGIEERFIRAAAEQLGWWAAADKRQAAVAAIFMGGGSPSALSAAGMRALFGAIRDAFDLAAPEITMEWYPADADDEKLDTALELGVTRFSIGAQSWNPATLASLGCHHAGEQVDDLIGRLSARGVTNYNIDLMCNAAGQVIGDHLDDIRRAAACGAAMISTNILELASGTPYSATGGTEADGAEKREWLRLIGDALYGLGYANQRVRNFYRDGMLHKYNRLCAGLDFDILPVGPGAYGYVAGMPVVCEPERRLWEQRAAGGAIAGYGRSSGAELRRSFVVNSLLELSIDAQAYTRRFLADPFSEHPVLAELRDQGILREQGSPAGLHGQGTPPERGSLWRLTRPGMEFADDISVAVYSDIQRGLFARHLSTGRSKQETQYFPVPARIPDRR